MRRLLFGALLLTACGHGRARVSGSVAYPADAPVYCADEVIVLHSPQLPQLTGWLAQATAQEGLRTTILTGWEANARRAAGGYPRRARVLRLEGSVVEHRRLVASGDPRIAPGVRVSGQGYATLIVYDAISSVELARLTAQARGDDAQHVRLQLRTQLLKMLWPHVEPERIPLPTMTDERVNEAISGLLYGRWSEARTALEGLAEECCRSDARERSAFLLILGVARRFDPRTLAADPARHFGAAVEALQEAVALDPDNRRAAQQLAATRAHAAAHQQLALQQQHCGFRP